MSLWQKKFIELHNDNSIFVVTFKDRILCLPEYDSVALCESSIGTCQAEEADQRLIRHLLNCIQGPRSFTRTVIRTIDTDVLILAVAFVAEQIDIIAFDGEVYVEMVKNKSIAVFNVVDMIKYFGKKMCVALLFFFTVSPVVTLFLVFVTGARANALMFG